MKKGEIHFKYDKHLVLTSYYEEAKGTSAIPLNNDSLNRPFRELFYTVFSNLVATTGFEH